MESFPTHTRLAFKSGEVISLVVQVLLFPASQDHALDYLCQQVLMMEGDNAAPVPELEDDPDSQRLGIKKHSQKMTVLVYNCHQKKFLQDKKTKKY